MTNGCSWTTWLKFKTSHPYLAEKAKRWCHQVGWHWNNCQFPRQPAETLMASIQTLVKGQGLRASYDAGIIIPTSSVV